MSEKKKDRIAAADVQQSGEISAKDRIAIKAEQLFAEHGYDGTSIRLIARAAQVPVALISYHFGNKLGLYRYVFELRAPTIVAERQAGLAIAALEKDPERRLELTVRSFLLPLIRLREEEGRKYIGTLLVREVTDPRSSERGIVEALLNPIARAVMDALHQILPERTEAEIQWTYQIMVGAMMFVVADTGRAARLSNGVIDPHDVEQTMRYVVPLLIHGIKNARVDQAEA